MLGDEIHAVTQTHRLLQPWVKRGLRKIARLEGFQPLDEREPFDPESFVEALFS